MAHNKALKLAPFGRWMLRDEAAQRRSALRYNHLTVYRKHIQVNTWLFH